MSDEAARLRVRSIGSQRHPSRRPRIASALSACTTAVVLAAALPASAWSQGVAIAPLNADADEAVPDNTLSSASLFKLLMSEIAAQRGAADAAYATELNLARETRDPRIARRATEFAVQARDPAAAVEAARLWTQLSPKSRVAADTFLTLLVLSGRTDEAQPLLAAKIEGATSKSQALAQVWGLLAQGQNRGQSLALMRRLADRYPALPEAHLVISQAALAAGDKTLALDEARTAVKLQPDAEQSTILLAQLRQYDAPKETDALLSSFIARNPKSTRMRLVYARFLNGEHRYDDTATQLARVRKDAPNDAETTYTLGLLAYQADKPKEAETYFKHFLALRTRASKESAKEAAKDRAAAAAKSTGGDEAGDGADDGDAVRGSAAIEGSTDANELPFMTGGRNPDQAYLYLAQIAEDAKDYPRALDWLAKVDDGNDAVTARIRRALILARQGKLDVARQELHAMPATTPAMAVQLTLAEAQMLRDAEQSQGAFDLLTTAIEKTPNNPDLLYDYGMTAEKLGRYDVLESAMRTVMRLNPNNAQAYNALGYTLADRNERLDEAKDLIEKAAMLAPDDASILDSLGWVQYRLGNNGEALQHLERAYKLRGDAEIAVHLGEVLWVSGRHVEAERTWREASVKEPQNLVLRQTLARFNVQMGKR